MMIALLILILFCIGLWYTVFVVFCDRPRRTSKSVRRANMTKPPPTAGLSGSAHPASLGWTALDDQQLTRLLKGSAPSP